MGKAERVGRVAIAYFKVVGRTDTEKTGGAEEIGEG